MTTNRSAIHTLGNDVRGLTTTQDILDAAGAGFTAIGVEPVSTFIGEDGLPTSMPVPALAIHRSDTLACLGVHSPGYQIAQYATIVDTALDVVGLTAGDGAVMAAGSIDGGSMFFCAIDLGTLTLDPGGIGDRIERHLIGWGSHNGKLPIMFVADNLRLFCKNQIPYLRAAAKQRGFMARHTKNMHDRLATARTALGIAENAGKVFCEQAEQLIRTPANHDTVTRTVNRVWPLDPEASENTRTRSASRMAAIHRLFDAPTNAPAVGSNGWAVFNSVGEYLDHHRGGGSEEKRAVASLVPGGWVEARKADTAKVLLTV